MTIELAKLSSAERLLWSYGVTEAQHIDLDGIASDRGAKVIYRPLEGCEARLVVNDDRAIISVNSTTSNEGRKRFSLAHELAHWICDRNAGSFLCAKEDIGPQNAEAKSVEANANSFASQLILPDYLVSPWMIGKRTNLDVASQLRDEFNASLTASAIKLVKRSSTPSCVACHSQSKLVWFQKNPSFPMDFHLKRELHQETSAFNLAFGASTGISRPKREPADRWLSGRDAYRLTIESQSVKLPDSTVLTVLSGIK